MTTSQKTTLFLRAILLLGTLIGCSESLDFSEIEGKPFVNTFVFEKLSKGKPFVTSVKPGDIIYLEAEGEQTRETTITRTKTVKSSWIVREREPIGIRGHFTLAQKKVKGKCQILHRNLTGKQNQPVTLDQTSPAPQFAIEIGGKNYDLKESFRFINNKFHATFYISKEIVLNGQDFFLKVTPEKGEKIKLGFLKYLKCPNRKKEYFSIKKNKKSWAGIRNVKRTYNISVHVVRSEFFNSDGKNLQSQPSEK